MCVFFYNNTVIKNKYIPINIILAFNSYCINEIDFEIQQSENIKS